MRTLPALLVAVALLATACARPAPTPAAPSTAEPTPIPVAVAVPADARSLVADDDAFGIDLLAALPQQGNVALSPASVATALQMVATGARGTTAAELAHVLHLPGAAAASTSAQALLTGLSAAQHQPGTTLKVADAVWAQRGLPLVPAYTNTLRTRFAAAAHTVDFGTAGAREQINATVSGQTSGLIPALFPPGSLDGSTRLVLTNAVYLKAAWAHAFPAGLTAPGPFHTGEGTTITIPMMHADDQARYGYGTGPGYQAVTLPYRGGRLAFTVLLPTGSLDAMLETLRAKGLPSVLSAITPAAIELAMPKFDVSSNLDLVPALTRLGMPAAFTPAADFSGISPRPLSIQTVRHDAVVHVDEHGTIAAAATGVGMQSSAIAVRAVVTVDRPFLFVLTDTATGAPLFLGRVTDPAS